MGEDWIKQVDSNYETKTKGHWVSFHAFDCLSVENMMNVELNLCLSGVTAVNCANSALKTVLNVEQRCHYL